MYSIYVLIDGWGEDVRFGVSLSEFLTQCGC